MTTGSSKSSCDPAALGALLENLRGLGIDLDVDDLAGSGPVKVVCIKANLHDSVQALTQSARDRVVMVRVDSDTAKALDAWVETGAVRSRSEAAALFIREGLKVRGHELQELEDAIAQVEDAKDQLRKKARDVLGQDSDEAQKPNDP